MSLRSLMDDAWGQGVANVRRSCGGDLAQMDFQFLEQHKGGDVVCHKDGPLVCVIYWAPGWQHAEEFAAVLSHTRVDDQ